VLADKAYDADRIRELIQDQGATPNIPPKSNRRWKPCFSKRLYRERNLIERFFSKLKHFRRVATRYDKLAAGQKPSRLRHNELAVLVGRSQPRARPCSAYSSHRLCSILSSENWCARADFGVACSR
jgi:hypothetical protein